MNYVLNEQHEAVKEPDISRWAEWFESADRTVARDSVGPTVISTVFLGIDYGFGLGRPLLFETMIFGSSLFDSCWRYSTWDEAVAGHARAFAWATKASNGLAQEQGVQQ